VGSFKRALGFKIKGEKLIKVFSFKVMIWRFVYSLWLTIFYFYNGSLLYLKQFTKHDRNEKVSPALNAN